MILFCAIVLKADAHSLEQNPLLPLLCWAKGYGDKAAPQELLVLREAEILSWGEHCFCPSSRRCFTFPGSETTRLWAANVPWALQLVRGKAEPARGVSEHLPLVPVLALGPPPAPGDTWALWGLCPRTALQEEEGAVPPLCSWGPQGCCRECRGRPWS